MKLKKLLNLWIILILILFMFSGCISEKTSHSDVDPEKNTNNITVTDMFDREITLKSKAEKAVAIGPGALRLYCYVSNIDRLVGIEQIEKDRPIGRPYLIANPSLVNLEVIGPGGPNNSPDFEKILSVKPDVIFSSFYDKGTVEKVQAKTGIPVIALSYGKASTFDPSVYQSIEIIGTIMGEEDRARDVVNYIKACHDDLNNRTKDIPEDEKPSTYVGALSYKGAHGIESTYSNYALFNAINAKSVVREIEKTGTIMIDKEKLLEWNPDKIFIDLSGLQLVKNDYNKNSEFYDALDAFSNGEVYSQLPYNFYNTNIDTSIADAYYLGKILFPNRFEDIDPEIKADEIYEFLVGQKVYAQMEKDFGGFEKISIHK